MENLFSFQIVLDNCNVINYLVSCNATERPWQHSLVYGPPVLSLRPMFWTLLNEIEAAYCGPWLIVRDFNVVLNQSDKNRGNPVASSSNGGFQNMIDFNGLLDLEFIGSPFTWSNRRIGNANIRERLDRAFANGE